MTASVGEGGRRAGRTDRWCFSPSPPPRVLSQWGGSVGRVPGQVALSDAGGVGPARAAPEGEHDRDPDQEEQGGEEERVAVEQVEPVQAELGAVVLGDPPDGGLPEQHRGGNRPELAELGAVLAEPQPTDDRHHPHHVVVPGDGGDQEAGGRADQDPEQAGRRPVGPGGHHHPGDADRQHHHVHHQLRHQGVVDADHRGLDVLIADVVHADPAGLEGVVGPERPGQPRNDGEHQEGGRREGHHHRDRGAGPPGQGQEGHEDERGELDRRRQAQQHSLGERPLEELAGDGQVTHDEEGQQDVDLGEVHGLEDGVEVVGGPGQGQGPPQQPGPGHQRSGGSDGDADQPHQQDAVEPGPQVDRRLHLDPGQGKKGQPGNRRIQEGQPVERRPVGVHGAVEEVPGPDQIDIEVVVVMGRQLHGLDQEKCCRCQRRAPQQPT